MNPLIKQILIMAGIYFGIFVFTLIFANIQSKGLLFKYWFVKIRKKKRMLIFIRGVTGPYIKVGKITESKLHWKNAGKDKMSVPLEYKAVFDFNRVSAITYDEVTNNFIAIEEGKEVNKGIDPIKVDIMVQRAYLLGLLKNASNILIIMIVTIVTLLAVFFLIYQSVKTGKNVELAVSLLQSLNATLNPASGVVPL